MRTIFLFYLIICSLGIFAQTNSEKYPNEYQKATNNTYEKINFPNSIVVHNVINPFKGITNTEAWQDWYIVTNVGNTINSLVKTYIGPYLKNIKLEEDDELRIIIWHSLNGEVAYTVFDYPTNLNIPIEAIELLDTALKKDAKIKISPISKHKEGVYYIQRIANAYLKDIQKELFAPSEPSQNEDIVVQLGEFSPSLNYEFNEKSKSIYPYMFDFTDAWNHNSTNVYISGIGKARISFTFINQTNHDISLDMSKISVRLDGYLGTIEPEISNITTYDNGKMISINQQKVVIPEKGGSTIIIFQFDNIINAQSNWNLIEIFDCKLSIWYGNKNILSKIIDERHDYTWEDSIEATWYEEGYIMFRYIYNKNRQEMYYNRATDKYSY